MIGALAACPYFHFQPSELMAMTWRDIEMWVRQAERIHEMKED